MTPKSLRLTATSHFKGHGMEKEVVYGQIIAKANHYQAVPDHNGGRRIIKDAAIKAYEKNFMQQCKVYKDKGINTPFTLFVKVFHSSMRYDIDNSLKTLLDCLQYVHAITDDNLCMKIVAEKAIDRQRPRMVFGIETRQQELFT